MFYPVSLLIPLIVLLPNLFFFRTKPNNIPSEAQGKENPVLASFEGIGRIGVFVLPLFSSIHLSSPFEIGALIGMIISITLYYLGWARYFRQNREFRLLLSPMSGIPVPLAVSPIIYFLLAAVVLHSPYMLVCTAILAAGHIPISLGGYYRITKVNQENNKNRL